MVSGSGTVTRARCGGGGTGVKINIIQLMKQFIHMKAFAKGIKEKEK